MKQVTAWLLFFLVSMFFTTAVMATPARKKHIAALTTSKIPIRDERLPTGSKLIKELQKLGPKGREKVIYRELIRGNIPSFMHAMVPVNIDLRIRNGLRHKAVIWATPDYLAVGSDTDFVRVPMSASSAQSLADRFGMMLPTRKIVDAIYRNAKVHLTPEPMKASPRMGSVPFFSLHNSWIRAQLEGKPEGILVSGHKKDVVLSRLLFKYPDRVAIYGWHRRIGDPIQPLSIVHGKNYADYSHGIRFISKTMMVDGVERFVKDILKHPVLSRLISDEGTLENISYL
jgi:hypothetical protein